MKKLVFLSLVCALAACKAEPAKEPAAADTATAPATEAAATVANGTQVGMFEVTMKDGSTITADIKADGTYSDMDASGKVTASGKWAVKDGKTCFMPDGKDEECWTETAPGPDGSFTATPVKGGDPVTVKPKSADVAPPKG